MEKKKTYDVYLYRYGREPEEIAKGTDRAEADRLITLNEALRQEELKAG